MRGGAVVLVGLLAGCPPPEPQAPEPEPEEVTAPSGGKGFVVECLANADCVRQASARCELGYELNPLGETGKKTTTKSKATAVAVTDNIAIAGGKSETEESSTKQYLVECKTERGTLNAPCQSDGDCTRLRVALIENGLKDMETCAPDLDGVKRCTFPCEAKDDEETSKRLADICGKLSRRCVDTSKEHPPTCH
ncbi:MAG: hypothetical protein IPI67_18075 [Myxococcales bacterium]|nr:hypothetical protein [Myxococcales bacterium]